MFNDRYFNYRTTRFLAEEGFYKFHNWFDDRAWYPLGRIIGGTIYPGTAEGHSFQKIVSVFFSHLQIHCGLEQSIKSQNASCCNNVIIFNIYIFIALENIIYNRAEATLLVLLVVLKSLPYYFCSNVKQTSNPFVIRPQFSLILFLRGKINFNVFSDILLDKYVNMYSAHSSQ